MTDADRKGFDSSVIQFPKQPTLQSGGGGGTFDPMEARVKTLEDRFEKVDSKLDAIRSDLAYVKGKIENAPSAQAFGELKGHVDGLPSKGFIVSSTLGAIAFFTAIILFQDRIIALISG